MSYEFKKHKRKLECMIANNYPYEKILEQSQLLDKYIVVEMKKMNATDK